MSPRRAARIDANQPAVVEVFLKSGWSVLSLAAVGKGVHDLLIGRPGIAVLVEVKDGDKVTSKRKLTDDQVRFHREWTGPSDICTCLDEAMRIAKFWHDRAMGVHSHDTRSRSLEQEVPGATS